RDAVALDAEPLVGGCVFQIRRNAHGQFPLKSLPSADTAEPPRECEIVARVQPRAGKAGPWVREGDSRTNVGMGLPSPDIPALLRGGGLFVLLEAGGEVALGVGAGAKGDGAGLDVDGFGGLVVSEQGAGERVEDEWITAAQLDGGAGGFHSHGGVAMLE